MLCFLNVIVLFRCRYVLTFRATVPDTSGSHQQESVKLSLIKNALGQLQTYVKIKGVDFKGWTSFLEGCLSVHGDVNSMLTNVLLL